ncbi:MAG: hypothetical protein OIN86_13895 [Candidatus Methanoperedens sp.]|nr:hypothetical protein [Candidatus Methanoperedens sp.]
MDINPEAVMVARNRLDFSYATLDADNVAPEIKAYVGDACSLDLIRGETIAPLISSPSPSQKEAARNMRERSRNSFRKRR